MITFFLVTDQTRKHEQHFFLVQSGSLAVWHHSQGCYIRACQKGGLSVIVEPLN